MKKNCCIKTVLDAWEKTALPTIPENQRDTWVVLQVLALNISCSETKNSDLCHISVDEVGCWWLTMLAMLTTRTQTLRLLTEPMDEIDTIHQINTVTRFNLDFLGRVSVPLSSTSVSSWTVEAPEMDICSENRPD